MSTHKHFDTVCVAVILLSLIVTVLFMNGEALGVQVLADEDAETYTGTEQFTANDQDGAWDTSGATIITLEGESAKVSGAGAYAYDGSVYITGGGWYVISGSLTDGGIVVDAYSSSKVWILLDGVDITCSDGPCLRVEQAEKVFLTLAEGTENTFSSGAEYSEEALADGIDGAIFARDDLTVNGDGSLTVTALYKHGVVAKDDLVITGGTVTVTAARDAIRANDSVRVKDADITLTAEDDGVAVSDGYFYMESGSLSIACGGDGVHTVSDVTIAGGDIAIDAGDDGVHSDTRISVSDGTVLIARCYEGLEAPAIEVSGGDITVYPTDDGFNASDGSGETFGRGGPGGSGEMGPGGEAAENTEQDGAEEPAEKDGVPYILITGGSVTVINETAQDADGLDSNGDILITGGAVRISLVNSGSNSALDCGSENGGVMEISGGTVIACGSYSMAEGFDESSAQCSVLYNLSEGVEAGTTVALEDADGNVLLTWEVPCSFSSVVLSSQDMELEGGYLVVIGDSVEEVVLDNVSASYGDAQSAMFGGPMNWGGMQRREDFGGMGGRGRNNASGEMSASAEQNGQTAGEADAMSTEAPQVPDSPSGEMGGGRGGWAEASGELSAGEEAETEESTVSAATWALIGASALILLAGVLIAVTFKQK